MILQGRAGIVLPEMQLNIYKTEPYYQKTEIKPGLQTKAMIVFLHNTWLLMQSTLIAT